MNLKTEMKVKIILKVLSKNHIFKEWVLFKLSDSRR